MDGLGGFFFFPATDVDGDLVLHCCAAQREDFTTRPSAIPRWTAIFLSQSEATLLQHSKWRLAISTKLILEAIALRKQLAGTYNGTRFLLAPQILYTRHGDLHLDAVPLEKNGRAPRESRLSTFKLAGLREVELVPDSFSSAPAFQIEDSRYQDSILFALQD